MREEYFLRAAAAFEVRTTKEIKDVLKIIHRKKGLEQKKQLEQLLRNDYGPLMDAFLAYELVEMDENHQFEDFDDKGVIRDIYKNKETDYKKYIHKTPLYRLTEQGLEYMKQKEEEYDY